MKYFWMFGAVANLVSAGMVVSKGNHWDTAGCLLMGLACLAWSMR